MIAKKAKAKKEFQKSREANISDLVQYIRDARQEMSVRLTTTADHEKVICKGASGFIFTEEKAQLGEMVQSCLTARHTPDHWIIAWPYDEQPTPAQLAEAANLFVKEVGMEGHQFVWGAHGNTDSIHIHIALSRVSPETGKILKINKGFDRLAAQKAICVITHRQGWRQVDGIKYEMTAQGPQLKAHSPRGLSDAARSSEVANAIESLERRARALAPEIAASTSWQDLHRRLAVVGVTYEKRKGGAVIKFGKSGFVKASKADRAASLHALEKRFGQPFQRPQRLAPKPYEPAPPKLRRDLDPISLILALLFHLLGLHKAARTLLHTRQELERAELRQTKFQTAQQKWAAQSVMREEHTAARKELKSAQDAEISQIKAFTPQEALAFCEKNNLFPNQSTLAPKAAQAGQGEGRPLEQKKEAFMAEELNNFERIHKALGADRYRLTAKEDNPLEGEGKHFAYGKREAGPESLTATGAFVGWTVDQVREHMPRVGKTAEGGRYGTYVTPLDKDTHYILIDDINSPEKREKAGKYSAALVCESSPGNQQWVLKVRADGDPVLAKKAANATAARINQECGDPAVCNGEQAFRLAGFNNNKPKHMKDGQAPLVKILSADGGYCGLAQSIYMEEVSRLRSQERPVAEQKEAPVSVRGAVPTGEMAQLGIEWTYVYGIHATDINQRVKLPLTGRRLDYAVACRLRAMGYSDGEAVRVVSHSREWNEVIRYGDTAPQNREQELSRAQNVVDSAYYTPGGDRDAGRLGENAVKAARRAEREYAKSVKDDQQQAQAVESEQKIEQTQNPVRRKRRARSR